MLQLFRLTMALVGCSVASIGNANETADLIEELLSLDEVQVEFEGIGKIADADIAVTGACEFRYALKLSSEFGDVEFSQFAPISDIDFLQAEIFDDGIVYPVSSSTSGRWTETLPVSHPHNENYTNPAITTECTQSQCRHSGRLESFFIDIAGAKARLSIAEIDEALRELASTCEADQGRAQ